jgi:uncharacterized protein YjbI with pentapeptide repeats
MQAYLKEANLNVPNLSEADLSGADLAQVRLFDAPPTHANLDRVDLSRALLL